MTLADIQKDIIDSVKKRDMVRAGTLRFLLSAIRNSAIAKYGAEAEAKLTDADVLDVIKKQVKEHKDSIDAYTAAKRQDLVDTEVAQLTILETFLPAQLTDVEILSKITPILSSGETNFGMLMKQCLAAVGTGADGGRIAAIIKKQMAV